MGKIIALWMGALCCAGVGAQTVEREEVGFELIQKKAEELAKQPYSPPDTSDFPEWMSSLTYDQYRDIRFNTKEALWAAEELPFRAEFYHPGYAFKEPVKLNEFTSSHQQRIRFAEAYFSYGGLVGDRGVLPEDGGFAGFRVLSHLNSPELFDELVSFQGASYWRALGKGQRYGLSSRGIAVDTGIDGVAEEFPSFREFWLKKPEKDSDKIRLFALMDGPSCTGAYSISIMPGDETVMEVQTVIFMRKAVQRIGIAPMSSMYWFGENSRRRFDDFRPEVHDSDGLVIRQGNGERIWRPLSNDTGRNELSFFSMDKCEGFGLLQRDRRFAAYEDAEASYHMRPSLWIEPTSEWGPGRVMLLELATHNELADNIVAMWEPKDPPQPGQRLEFAYRQRWTMNEDPSQAIGHVVASRSGLHDWQPEQRTVLVDFAGLKLEEGDLEKLSGFVEIQGENAPKLKAQGITVQPMPEGVVRLAFQLTPVEEGAKLAETGPVELRCCLKRGEDFVTETWANRIHP